MEILNIFSRNTTAWKKYMEIPIEIDIDNVNQRAKRTLQYLGINEETLSHVREIAEFVRPYKTEILSQFMESLLSVERFAHVINKHSNKNQLYTYLEQYLDEFLKGEIHQRYIESRLQIGKVVSYTHLTPEYFIPAYQVLIQFITTILMNKLHRKPKKMLDSMLAVQKLSTYDLQLIEQAYMEDTDKYFLFRISDMLESVTKLDTTEQLIKGMEEQISETHSVNAATEEMGASIHEVASNAVDVAESTEEAVQSANKSQTTIQESLEDIQEVGKVFDVVVSKVGQLETEIQQTQEVISIIKGIAEQTNLLALNASIEAARAGEHGRGFAVVASEVRKLSEHTNEQIKQIESNLVGLGEVSNHVATHIKQTGELVEKNVRESQYAQEALDSIITTMQAITSSTSQIAAMSEEQTSAVQDIAERSNVIYSQSLETQSISLETGRLLLELSEQMEDYRNLFLDLHMHMEYKDIVKIAITDHLMLKWKTYNTLLGLTDYTENDFPTHHDCQLGKWYYGDLPERVKNMQTFKDVESPHRAVHEYAKEAVHLYRSGKLNEAKEAMTQLSNASTRVIELLKAME